VNGGKADDRISLVHRDEEHVRRRVLDYELVPFLWRKHRRARELAEVRPPVANRGIKHRANALGRRGRQQVGSRSCALHLVATAGSNHPPAAERPDVRRGEKKARRFGQPDDATSN
jgi:hypothetical protein